MLLSQPLQIVLLSLIGLAQAAPAPAAIAPRYKHGETITTYDDKLLGVLPTNWNKSTPIKYFSCNEAVKSGGPIPDYCQKVLPSHLQKDSNFTASAPASKTPNKRDAWVGPVRNPWGETCDWQANAEYGLAPDGEGFTYYDADWVQLVNYNNQDEVWAGWLLNDDVRESWDWSWFYLTDLRTILYVANKWQNTYKFYTVTFQIHELGYTWRDMNNGAECWQNEWNTFFGRRTLYQCYFPCSALLW